MKGDYIYFEPGQLYQGMTRTVTAKYIPRSAIAEMSPGKGDGGTIVLLNGTEYRLSGHAAVEKVRREVEDE